MNDNLSISMIIDNGLKKDIYSDSFNDFKPLPLKNSINLDERKIHSWVDETNVIQCYNCSIEFSFTNRKHHCRNCGKVFCYKCSDYFIKIPETIKTVEKKNNLFHYQTYLDYLNINSELERVCEKCYRNIFELKELNKIIKYFDLLPLTIFEYKQIAVVCRSWNKIAKYYLNQFREIQYLFPDHQFTKKETNIINLNKELYVGHSKWLLQLILNNNWSDNKKNRKILELIKYPKKKCSCWSLMCTRSCNNTLETEDIIIILSKNIVYTPLIKLIFNIWKKRLQKEETILEISCYMYLIVNKLNFYKNYTDISNIIETFLLNLCKTNIGLSNQLFWILTQCISNPNSSLYYKNFRQKLVKQLDKKSYRVFQTGYDFTLNIIKIANSNRDNMVEGIKEYIKECNSKIDSFSLPVDFDKNFKSIDYTKIRDIDSKTKPIILPCIYDDNRTFNIMLKNEDIRKEAIIMKIIKLMDYFLKKEENLDLYVTTYNILPISHEYGYIEFVPNSTTLYNLREESKFSIQNWIIEKNHDININTLRNNISKSCALYCIATYLLGIGDRHLDNIMITNKGRLFHIDFGYILGRDPKLISPDIRLTPEMIDAMGGINSEYYMKFKNYCGIAYNCMRRHAPIFYTMLLDLIDFNPPLDEKNLTREYIKKHIIDRFIPGETYDNAINQIKYKLDINSNTYSENIIDFFHKKCKSSNSRSSSKSEELINKAIDIGNVAKNKFLKGFTKLFS